MKRNRNKKGLSLNSTTSATESSNRSSVISSGSSATYSPLTGSGSSLTEQLASLELGVEYKLDLRYDDLKVIKELGSGNSGTVSRVVHIPTKQVMARKVVHLAASEGTRKQILRELQIMHDCHSPYIVSFYGAYLHESHICMCMEYMDKLSLDQIYKRIGPIQEDILGEIAFSVVSGLTYLYETHKIMHRDVKPSNILLNSAGQIKICDFGVSGELVNSVADTFVGTSTYMSPERISGEAYTVKSDVWSLGISLIELGMGRFPFNSEEEENDNETITGVSLAGTSHHMSILELLQFIVNEPPPRLPAKFSQPAHDFVNAMLRKESGASKSALPRPTPNELLKFPWMVSIKAQNVDLRAFASSIPN